jgi:hypothetical protein
MSFMLKKERHGMPTYRKALRPPKTESGRDTS